VALFPAVCRIRDDRAGDVLFHRFYFFFLFLSFSLFLVFIGGASS
jgi:hypothetical protein